MTNNENRTIYKSEDQEMSYISLLFSCPEQSIRVKNLLHNKFNLLLFALSGKDSQTSGDCLEYRK